jgi:hypothetical protein
VPGRLCWLSVDPKGSLFPALISWRVTFEPLANVGAAPFDLAHRSARSRVRATLEVSTESVSRQGSIPRCPEEQEPAAFWVFFSMSFMRRL